VAVTARIIELENQITALSKELRAERIAAPAEELSNFEFQGPGGPTSLLDLFNGHDELLVIHNMGQSCDYCSLWAAGFNGLVDHFLARSAFVLVSPDTPEQQTALAAARGWRLPMVQDATREFTTAAGFWNASDGWWPGASGFRREGNKILRTGKTEFFPHDQFCSIWPLMDLIGGSKSWEPTFPS